MRRRRSAARKRRIEDTGNAALEKRRRQLEREKRRRQRREDGTWKALFKSILEFVPYAARAVFKIFVVLLFAFVYDWFFGQQVRAVGDSLKPVLSNGDTVLVNRIVYNAMRPRRGDIVVFKPKGNKSSHYYIKRIIGLPGETVEIVEDSIFIDGERLEEEYETSGIDDVGIVTEKMKLGNNEYFVLGDDRANSEDSRDADVGNVKRSYIYGKAWFVSSPRKHMGFVR